MNAQKLAKLNDLPVVSILLGVLAVVVVLAGAIVTIVRPASLPFHDFVIDVTILTAALGLGAGVGRGAIAAAKVNTDNSASTDVATDVATSGKPPEAVIAAEPAIKPEDAT